MFAQFCLAPFWLLLLSAQLLVCATLSWTLLARCDFSYPLAYKLLSIDQHIATFAPQNRFKPDFADTDKAQHLQLFAAIGEAIESDGEGLGDIRYRNARGEEKILLRPPEREHLEYVAWIISDFYRLGGISALIYALLLLIAWRGQLQRPGAASVLLGLFLAVGSAAIIIAIVGPHTIFRWLHMQAFPADHKWFFYYQESLMTTLMKAPDLFGFIAAELVALALLLWVLAFYGLGLLTPSAPKTPLPSVT